jgi:ABC-type anion transport system duplicated permease subunit
MQGNELLGKPDTETSLYIGAATTAIVCLLPYVNVFILPAYIIGALVAIWHAVSIRGQRLQFKDGAKLGFLSTFFGVLVGLAIGDLIWLFLDYQLWQRQNARLLLAILASFLSPVALDVARDRMAEQAAKPFQWYVFLWQLVGSAIFCGILGTLFGLLGVKIFRPRESR